MDVLTICLEGCCQVSDVDEWMEGLQSFHQFKLSFKLVSSVPSSVPS